MEPCNVSPDRLAAERWLDEDGSFSSEAVAQSKRRKEGPALARTASFSSDRLGDGTEVLTLNGKCDLSMAALAEQRIVSALDAGTTEIIFDLRGVTSMSRSMLQVLFRAHIRMGRNGRLILVRPNSHVWAIFEESGLDKGFSTFPDLKGALAEVSVRGPEDLLAPGLPSASGLGGTR
jgi:anti-anti-sigma factor